MIIDYVFMIEVFELIKFFEQFLAFFICLYIDMKAFLY